MVAESGFTVAFANLSTLRSQLNPLDGNQPHDHISHGAFSKLQSIEAPPVLTVVNGFNDSANRLTWKRHEVIRRQIEEHIPGAGLPAQPAGELVGHESGGDVGGVDGGFGGAGAGLGFELGEEGGGVVGAGVGGGGGEDPQGFTAHAAIGPELAAGLEGTPEGGAGGDGVDAAEDGLAGFLVGAEAVGDDGDVDVGVD